MFPLPRAIEFLFYLFIFFVPLQTRWIWHRGFINGGAWEYGTFSIYGTEILLWVILILYFVQQIKSFKFQVSSFKINSKTVIILSLFGLIAVSSLSIFWAGAKYVAFNSTFLSLEGAALWMFIVRFPLDLKKIAWSFSFSGVMQSILAFWQFGTQNVYGSKWLGMAAQNPSMVSGESVIETGSRRFLRAYGTFSHPNILGGFLVISILLSIYLYFRSKERKSQVLGLVFGITNIFGLTLTFSRSAFVAFIVSSILYLVFIFFRGKGNLTRAIFFTVMFMASTLFFGIIFQSIISPRFNGGTRLEQKSIAERGEYLKESFALVQNHMAVGVGKGNFTESVRREIHGKKSPWEYQPVHNIYLLVFSELGAVGLFLFLIFLSAVSARSILKKNYLGLVLWSALIIIGFFDHYLWSLYPGIIVFWLVLGIAEKPLTEP